MSCRSSPPTRESSSARSLRAGLIALSLFIGSAPASPAAADDVLSARVRGVLATYCAPCREVSGGAELDLAAIVRDPNLVRPGNPDGSPAYADLIRRIGSNAPTASADELGALRDWITSLPVTAAACASAIFPPRVRIEVELARVATAKRKPMSAFRVLSLNHLDLGCATREQHAAWQQTIGLIVAAVAGKTQAARTHALDADGRVLAIDIQDLGWDTGRWRALLGMTSGTRRSDEPLVARADQFVARALRGASGADDPDMSDVDRQIARTMLTPLAAPDSIERHIAIMLQLARQHLAPLGLTQLAAELGVKSEVLKRDLAQVAKVAPDPWLRLVYGNVPRSEIEKNWTLIARSAGLQAPAHANAPAPGEPARPAATAPEAPIEVTIYPDRLRYAPGDPLQLTVRSNIDCALTVISIDTAGYGTVIFPNDFAPSHRIGAHLDVALPAKGARYRFRVKEKGRERIIALCTRAEGAVDGIRHNFERQRFQELGHYAAFLDAALKRAENPSEEKADAEGPPPVPQSQIWRTGILIDVE